MQYRIEEADVMARGSSEGRGGNARGSVIGMVLIRLFLGGFFLYSGLMKVLASGGFIGFLEKATSPAGSFVVGNNWPGYASFLTNVVSPQAELFGWLVIAGELSVGALLIIGLLTRAAALVALALKLLHLLATMQAGTTGLAIDVGFIVMALATFMAASGRTLGVDALLARRFRAKLLW